MNKTVYKFLATFKFDHLKYWRNPSLLAVSYIGLKFRENFEFLRIYSDCTHTHFKFNLCITHRHVTHIELPIF